MPFSLEIRPVYGDKYFMRPAIHVWCKMFDHGRESVVDEENLVTVDNRCKDRSGQFLHVV